MVVDPVRESYVPALLRMGPRSGPDAAASSRDSPGNVLGDRAVPAMSRRLGHVGLHRAAAADDRSSPLETGGGSRRRRGLAVSPGCGPTGTRRGPTCVCGSRPYREAGVTPDGSRSTCCIAGAASEAAPRYGRSTMPRVMCVWFPRWPIQRLRSERPELRRSELVLFAGQAQRPIVTECTPKAERHGVRIGQPLAEARALLPRAVFLPADDAADSGALRQLALECQRFSPLVGLEDGPQPASLLCNVDGCTHLWGGESRFLRACSRLLARPRLSTSSSPWPARWERPGRSLTPCAFSVVPAGEEAQALSSLPVATLRLPPTVLDRLHALGLGTIGDVLRLPREMLAGRFGVAPAATAGPGTGPAARVLRLRAIDGTVMRPSASGRCRLMTA